MTGVYFNAWKQKWAATTQRGKKRVFVGWFDDEDTAIDALLAYNDRYDDHTKQELDELAKNPTAWEKRANAIVHELSMKHKAKV